jgi:hypothetical protein
MFDGFAAYPSAGTYYYEGVSAFISVRAAPLCGYGQGAPPPPDVRSMAWTMISNGNNGDGWVQSGYRVTYTAQHHFMQAFRGQDPSYSTLQTRLSPSQILVPDPAVDTGHQYVQEYVPSCLCSRSWVDSAVAYTAPWNIKTWWAEPFSPQFEGEVTYLNSDMPGTPANPTWFAQAQGQGYGHGWVPLACILTSSNQNPARWANFQDSCTTFRIWTAVP